MLFIECAPFFFCFCYCHSNSTPILFSEPRGIGRIPLVRSPRELRGLYRCNHITSRLDKFGALVKHFFCLARDTERNLVIFEVLNETSISKTLSFYKSSKNENAHSYILLKGYSNFFFHFVLRCLITFNTLSIHIFINITIPLTQKNRTFSNPALFSQIKLFIAISIQSISPVV